MDEASEKVARTVPDFVPTLSTKQYETVPRLGGRERPDRSSFVAPYHPVRIGVLALRPATNREVAGSNPAGRTILLHQLI
jgi:hypothetical protein